MNRISRFLETLLITGRPGRGTWARATSHYRGGGTLQHLSGGGTLQHGGGGGGGTLHHGGGGGGGIPAVVAPTQVVIDRGECLGWWHARRLNGETSSNSGVTVGSGDKDVGLRALE